MTDRYWKLTIKLADDLFVRDALIALAVRYEIQRSCGRFQNQRLFGA